MADSKSSPWKNWKWETLMFCNDLKCSGEYLNARIAPECPGMPLIFLPEMFRESLGRICPLNTWWWTGAVGSSAGAAALTVAWRVYITNPSPTRESLHLVFHFTNFRYRHFSCNVPNSPWNVKWFLTYKTSPIVSRYCTGNIKILPQVHSQPVIVFVRW